MPPRERRALLAAILIAAPLVSAELAGAGAYTASFVVFILAVVIAIVWAVLAIVRVTARADRRWQAERRWLFGDLATTSGVVALLGGAVAEWLAWQAFVPWDLSEVDKVGQVIEPGRGDHLWPQILAALAVVTVAYMAIGLVWGRRLVVAASVGSAATWAFIWSWRASVSRVVGANFWLVSLVIVVLPAAIAAVLVVRAAVRANELRRARRPPPRT